MKDHYSTAPASVAEGSPARGGSRLRSRLAWGLAALLLASFLARLGLWQLSRAHEKTALAERIAHGRGLPPLSAAEVARDPASAPSQWERRVALAGRWIPERTFWLMNRTMDEVNGFYVLTPLRLDDGEVVVVQRGWVAGDPARPLLPPSVQAPTDEVRVEGRLQPWPAHRIELGRAASGAVRQNLEPAAFAADTGLAAWPVIVAEEAAPANANDGLLRHWTQPSASPFTNYGYAVQWFAMSATVLGLYVWLNFVRRVPEEHSADA